MNTDVMTKIEKAHLRTDLTNFKVGDTVEVDNVIREGEKKRIQKFRGLVIAIGGSGTRKMFTVRKISYGIGVEKIFPLNSPNVAAVTVLKYGKTRRSKLYYLRQRIGKLALKVKPGEPAPVIEHAEEAMPEEVEPELATVEPDKTIKPVEGTDSEGDSKDQVTPKETTE